jgi:hypothetical protein
MIHLSKFHISHPGIDLDDVPEPGGAYVAVNIRQSNGTVAIQLPISKGNFYYQGVLGENITSEEGYQAARMCAINVIKQIATYVEESRFVGINHLQIFYRCSEDWDDAPYVADGASQLINEVFGDRGIHTRSIYAVSKLPRNFSVGVNATFTVNTM